MPEPQPWRIPVGAGYLHGGTWPGGADDAPTVVALHDLGANHRWWALVARELTGRATLLAPDLPGHGRSAGLDATTLDGQLSAIEALLAAGLTGDAPIVLAGHGTGALLAAHVATRLTSARVAGPLLGVVRVAPLERPDEVLAAAQAARARIGRTYAHRGDDLAWWRERPGLERGLNRSARWVAEGDVVGHGFGWKVLGDPDAIERIGEVWAAQLAAGVEASPCWPQVDVTVESAATAATDRARREQVPMAGATMLLQDAAAGATATAIRSLL
jgi:pimeloyl-ACP methyl ester carboxylesterase